MPNFVIHFADSRPGEPGTGGPDNTVHTEHYYWGTQEEAEAEAKQLSFERYRGDLAWWVDSDPVKYSEGIEESKIKKMNNLRSQYDFLDNILAKEAYPLFDIEESVIDASVMAEKCRDHGSEGPEAFDEQFYAISHEVAIALAADKESSPADRAYLPADRKSSPLVREAVSELDIDFLVRARHLKYEIDGKPHHDVTLTLYRDLNEL